MKGLLKVFSCSALLIIASYTAGLAQGSTPPDTAKNKGEIYTVVEQMPEFPGGQAAMMQYIRNNIKFPESAKRDTSFSNCRSFVKFIINETGQVVDPVIMRDCKGCAACDAEALRAIKAMPKWKAGKQNGKPVSTYYNLPISFYLK